MVRQSPDPMMLAEAAAYAGLAHNTLRVLVHTKRLKAHKRGKLWWVYRADLDAYKTSRHQGQRPKRKAKGGAK